MRVFFIRLTLLLPLLGYLCFPPPAHAQTQQAKLTAPNPEGGDNFSSGVALSHDGSVALIGAENDNIDEDIDEEGSAHVYVKDGSGNWTHSAMLTASDADTDDRFGAEVALSAEGDVALVAAPFKANGLYEDDRGAVYVFTRDGSGNWSEQQKLLASNGAQDDLFGYDVALSDDGTTAIIGAPETNYGSAYIFRNDGSGWNEETEIVLSFQTRVLGERFGWGVAIDGDGSVALVGVYNDEVDGNSEQGSAYAFTHDGGGNWTQGPPLTADDGAADDKFGYAVSLNSDGSRAAVGAPGKAFDGAVQQGAAYVFEADGSGGWNQRAKLTASDGNEHDDFGIDVSISSAGAGVIVGAWEDDVDGNETQGSVYAFSSDGAGSWTENGKIVASDGLAQDRFGFTVSFDGSGSSAIVSSHADDHPNVEGHTNHGSAYIFGIPSAAAPPSVTTGSAANITLDSAELHGTVNPNGSETSVTFIVHPTGLPGSSQSFTAEQSPLTGDSPQDVSATATFLQGDTEYTYFVSASNDAGVTNGTELTFTTMASNDPPTASLSFAPESPGVDEEITFDASGSSDSDGNIIVYRWDFDNDNTYDVVGEVATTTTHSFSTAGEHTVVLQVEDDDGAASTDQVVVAVRDAVQISITESISVSDHVGAQLPLEITITEAISVADQVDTQLPVRISITESIGVTDRVDAQFPVSIRISEQISVTDDVPDGISARFPMRLGDVTRDDRITAIDAALVLRHSVGLLTLEDLVLRAADVSGNGSIFPYDASLILMHFVGAIDCFPADGECAAGKTGNNLVAGSLSWGAPRSTGRDLIELPLVLEGAIGVTALDIEVLYDPARFEVVSVEPGTELHGSGAVYHRATHGTLHLAAAAATSLEGEIAVLRLRQTQHDQPVALEGTWTPNEGADHTLASVNMPQSYTLSENYPNPFNPETTIRYTLPEAAEVRLRVFDAVGREVTVLVNEMKQAGRHEVRFDAGELPSGVYFYRLEAGSYSELREMTLVK